MVQRDALQNCWASQECELIASGKAIRERKRLWRAYGKGRWRKLKGTANVQFADGTIRRGYEAHGIGPKEYKIKRILD
jgi:hypothetical protein